MSTTGIFKCPNCKRDTEAVPAEYQGSNLIGCKLCAAEVGTSVIMSQIRRIIICDSCGRREVQTAPGWFEFSLAMRVHDMNDFRPGSSGVLHFCTIWCLRKWFTEKLPLFSSWAHQDYKMISGDSDHMIGKKK